MNEEDIQSLYKLDWSKILYQAIKNRPTSWKEIPIKEWRNASDEVMIEVVNSIRQHHKIEHPINKTMRELNKK